MRYEIVNDGPGRDVVLDGPDPDIEAAAAGLTALAKHGIPVDVQELLVRGDPQRGIRPGALSAFIKATIESYRGRK